VLARNMAEIARLVVLEDNRQAGRGLTLQPRFQVRVVPSPVGGSPHRQVVVNRLGEGHSDSVRAGRAEVTTSANGSESLSRLGPIEALYGEIVSGGFVLDFASEVHEV
jgi:hypothetical protein